MSVAYRAVNWNRQKRIYDSALGATAIGLVALFAGLTALAHPDATAETILIRGLGLAAIALLHLILAVGPLTRLDRRFLPLLYNRRHLGVTMALLALAHAGFALVQFHALGNVNPFVSVLVSNRSWISVSGFPFELLGLGALVILVLMAATSHDFWLSVLTPPVWKRLHMLGYLAYLLVLGHVGLGVLQDERSLWYALPFALGAAAIGGLHLAAALRERARDREAAPDQDWEDVGSAASIPEGRALVGVVGGERVAVFRHEGRLSAVSNVCKHQNGPLGEGRIIDGCITCPWHGYQYRPDSGTSPPPFDDRIPTFNLRLAGDRVLVHRIPNPPGTRVEPVPVRSSPPAPVGRDEFYVGYGPTAPAGLARFIRHVVVTALVLVGAIVGAMALAQDRFAAAAFEYGRPTELIGTVRTAPYPFLEVQRPGSDRVSRYLLAAAGKHGAQAIAGPLDGRRVVLQGTLAYRDGLTLLEVSTTEPRPEPSSPAAAPQNLGTFDLVGEIVDGKCYLGVMNPGEGKTHRECAARCVAGGLPPMLVVRDEQGHRLDLLLVDRRGEPIAGIARWVGRPVAVTGRVARLGDLWLLEADPTSLRSAS
jgi:nitrite reductase/ring-hydroxylating ferredoxin subunit/DMSO/TMAO reductase YedYZ heme-binding membrane subunit